uniref:Uncharacterized protein n=1 Tax=Meloidogyne javanica TaxID=6303 RepID=A0A915N9S3_MELJA
MYYTYITVSTATFISPEPGGNRNRPI